MLCVTDCKLPRACAESLSRLGFEIVLLPPFASLHAPVASHADLLVFPFDKTLIVHSDYAKTASKELSRIASHGYSIKPVSYPVGNKYPLDVGLCAFISRGRLICNKKYTAPAVLELAHDRGLSVIDVRQGYAKCSCAVLADGAVITADRGISAALDESLLIGYGSIALPPYDYGFIGGACGSCGDTLYFTGNIKSHPDHESILRFCQAHSTKVVSLSDEPLFDVGSLFFL